MLFNLCNCAAPLVSSGDPLCIGGAGFVTAVMATLAANARTREAKRLRENVRKVDRLANGVNPSVPAIVGKVRAGVSSFAEEDNA